MRILHTSDWHLGRTFHGVDLLDDQRAALESIADVVAAAGIDVVVVAGDVYDRSVPSAGAVAVYDEGLARIRSAGAQLVVTSGNHDSPTRLGVGSAFAAAGGLHLRTSIAGITEPVVVSEGDTSVAIYGIPYLEPDTARRDVGVETARSHAEVLGAAMDLVRADLAERRAHADVPLRSVVAAHAFVVGAQAGGSERSISVGGVETVAASTFSDVDYVALGHLHSPQEITHEVRYSGSLLPYSFGERSDHKAVWILDIEGHAPVRVTRHDLPVIRGLSSLTGTLDELLTAADFAAAEEHYVEVTLTDAIRPIDAMRQLRARFPHAVHVQWAPPEREGGLDYRARVRDRNDIEIVEAFVEDMRDAASDAERALITAGLTAVASEPEEILSQRSGEITEVAASA
ncbi:exonuclease SbcCD subunit D [Gordonia jinhuaensis]|uniref:Nuclease SbcCD subunit D n=1 Tax=Gordonia jinhuaensis TaxID=1517702 RepID=A0A916SU97_9ACTN|nr:exonuclease SbcCD subunit D [Gordonia jinhuaensis]GGB16194.1 nuclease SbcCD subunit D [Gordonia jinhuaensis]